MAPNTVLILGAGPRVGYSVGRKFKAEGYQVAVASRSPDSKAAEKEGFFPVTVDLVDNASIEAAFKQVTQKLGTPNVVVYNAAALTFPPDPEDPFSVTPAAFVKDLGVNTIGAFVALRETVKGFKELSDVPKAFIATGNVLPFKPVPFGVTLGTGKAALVHLIQVSVQAYATSNYRSYFASQVTEEGNTVSNPELSADAHAAVYWKLVNQQEQGEWDVRFLGDGTVAARKT